MAALSRNVRPGVGASWQLFPGSLTLRWPFRLHIYNKVKGSGQAGGNGASREWRPFCDAKRPVAAANTARFRVRNSTFCNTLKVWHQRRSRCLSPGNGRLGGRQGCMHGRKPCPRLHKNTIPAYGMHNVAYYMMFPVHPFHFQTVNHFKAFSSIWK